MEQDCPRSGIFSGLTVILGQSHRRKDKVQNLIHHGAKHEGLTLTCQVGRRSGGKRALFQPVPRLNFFLCRIRTKSYKDKVMGPSERRPGGGFPSVPGVIFTNWRESLNAAALPGAVRAGYTLAIAGYLDYCRRNGISVTLESARGYMADVTRRGLARNPPLWKQGLNWYFGEGRKTSGRQKEECEHRTPNIQRRTSNPGKWSGL